MSELTDRLRESARISRVGVNFLDPDETEMIEEHIADAELREEAADALAQAATALGDADDLLRRLAEWDVMCATGGASASDGPYWQREIARTREALAVLRPDDGGQSDE